VEQLLSPEEKDAGFSIREEEDFVYLLRWSKVVAVFSSMGITPKAIHEAVRQEMRRQNKQ
jgi:hypothetical protein